MVSFYTCAVISSMITEVSVASQILAITSITAIELVLLLLFIINYLIRVSYGHHTGPCPSEAVANQEAMAFSPSNSKGLRWSPEIIISVAFCAISKARWEVHLL